MIFGIIVVDQWVDEGRIGCNLHGHRVWCRNGTVSSRKRWKGESEKR
jgi:hypothetical protein